MQTSRCCFVVFLLSASHALAATLVVHPGESIQAAVDGANPGDTIAVEPGTYREPGRPCPTDSTHRCAVVVSKDNLRLNGLAQDGRPVVLENAGGQDQGIAIAKQGAAGPACLSDRRQRIQGSTVEGLTVNHFAGEGIALF